MLKVGLMEPIPRWTSHWHPMGIMYIAAYLESRGHACHLVNQSELARTATAGDSLPLEERVMGVLERLQLDLLGISCAVNELNHVLGFARRLKARFPSLRIMAGGPMPTSMPDLFLRSGVIDFVVRREGEQIVENLVRCLEQGGDPGEVKGLSFRRENTIVHNPDHPLIENLDAIPFPAYNKTDMTQYTSMHEWVIRGLPVKGLFVLTSRGCPFSCSFCGAETVHGRRVRYRSADSIGKELELLKARYGLEGVFFSDDTLTLRRERVLELCSVMKGLDLVWGCFARVNTVDEELLKAMRASGCIQLDFGVESGSDRILKEIIRKGATVQEARDAFRLCHQLGLRTFANLMIGLPTETEAEMMQTYELACELRAHAYVLSLAMPLPGTGLWDMVNPAIAESEFDCLNWHGEDRRMTDICNRSLVPTPRLIELHHLMSRRLKHRALVHHLGDARAFWDVFRKRGNKGLRLRRALIFQLKEIDLLQRTYQAAKRRCSLVADVKNLFEGGKASRS